MISPSPTALKSLLVLTRKLVHRQLDGSKQFASVKGFAEKKGRSLRKSMLFYPVVMVSGDENDGQFGPFEADPALQSQTIHPWHPDVCHQTTRRCKDITIQEVF